MEQGQAPWKSAARRKRADGRRQAIQWEEVEGMATLNCPFPADPGLETNLLDQSKMES